jgi:hypothetical protein
MPEGQERCSRYSVPLRVLLCAVSNYFTRHMIPWTRIRHAACSAACRGSESHHNTHTCYRKCSQAQVHRCTQTALQRHCANRAWASAGHLARWDHAGAATCESESAVCTSLISLTCCWLCNSPSRFCTRGPQWSGPTMPSKQFAAQRAMCTLPPIRIGFRQPHLCHQLSLLLLKFALTLAVLILPCDRAADPSAPSDCLAQRLTPAGRPSDARLHC